MIDLNQILSPQYLDAFRRFMAALETDDQVAVGGGNAVDAILLALTTENGKLPGRRSGEPSENQGVLLGRADIASALIASVIGPEPVVEAWLIAAEHGFATFDPKTYGDDGSEKGSPGVYLKRLLDAYKATANDPKRAAIYAQVQRTELGILIFAMLLRQIKVGLGPRFALGTSFSIMIAVNRLSKATQRAIDGLTQNEEFLHAVGRAIEQVVAEYHGEGLVLRTNQQVRDALPTGVNPSKYFADRQQAKDELLQELHDEIVGAVDRRMVANPGTARAEKTGPLALIADSLVTKLAANRTDAETIASHVRAATAYLDDASKKVYSPVDLADHHRRLAALMPALSSGASAAELAARGLLAANFFHWRKTSMINRATMDPVHDAVTTGILLRIAEYALETGPPPPTTPLHHVGYFESVACFACVGDASDHWNSRPKWSAAGLLGWPDALHGDTRAMFYAMRAQGIGAFDPGALRDLT